MLPCAAAERERERERGGGKRAKMYVAPRHHEGSIALIGGRTLRAR